MREQSSNPKDRIGITKVPLHLLPITALAQQSLAHLDGSLKYGEYNWRNETVSASVYVAAMMRHALKYYTGETFDTDSGIHHLAHVAACCNILMDAQEFDMLVDDRQKHPQLAEFLNSMSEEVKRIQAMHRERQKPQCSPPERAKPSSEHSHEA